MKWKKVNEYFCVSDAGYKICKVYLGGEVRYEAWAPQGGEMIYLNHGASFDAAKAVCDEHVKKKSGRMKS